MRTCRFSLGLLEADQRELFIIRLSGERNSCSAPTFSSRRFKKVGARGRPILRARAPGPTGHFSYHCLALKLIIKAQAMRHRL